MRVILCLDDRGGMMFNHRRQSRDRVLIEDVVASLCDAPLYLAPYSQSLFADREISMTVSESFLSDATEGGVCFVEDRPLTSYLPRIDSMVIYRWNRHYPADLWCDLDPVAEGFHLTERTEFVGSSHDCITKETYQR